VHPLGSAVGPSYLPRNYTPLMEERGRRFPVHGPPYFYFCFGEPMTVSSCLLWTSSARAQFSTSFLIDPGLHGFDSVSPLARASLSFVWQPARSFPPIFWPGGGVVSPPPPFCVVVTADTRNVPLCRVVSQQSLISLLGAMLYHLTLICRP